MDLDRLTKSLNPLERRILPFLTYNNLQEIAERSGLSKVEAMRALQWLQNKKVLELKTELMEVVELGENGKLYLEKGLPERRFLLAIKDKELDFLGIKKTANLKDDEFNVCLGTLKKKVAIEIKNSMVCLTEQGNGLINKKSLEEEFLNKLSKSNINVKDLKPEEKFACEELKKRKDIIKISLLKERTIELTDIGKQLSKLKLKLTNVIERLTPEIVSSGSWKNMEFRRYDVEINVPKIHGGKRHFVNQAVEYARLVWLELGFKEMEGPLLNTSFWNFDALFTAQDHPVRELQDTFYVKDPAKGRLPSKELVEKVSKMHESGGNIKSRGWQYKWDPEDAKRNVLRTHTTVLSSRMLAQLKKDDLPAKYFAIGKCFRNETLDWSHLFEFNQFEGIVVDPDANFKHLLGYLKNFMKKIGFPKARFRPAHFPYTEPSVEIDVFHPVHKKWVELGGAGIFRPEVVVPLLGKDIPVLAWGPGLDRQMMEYYKISDLRELYKNDLKQLREIKFWLK